MNLKEQSQENPEIGQAREGRQYLALGISFFMVPELCENSERAVPQRALVSGLGILSLPQPVGREGRTQAPQRPCQDGEKSFEVVQMHDEDQEGEAVSWEWGRRTHVTCSQGFKSLS